MNSRDPAAPRGATRREVVLGAAATAIAGCARRPSADPEELPAAAPSARAALLARWVRESGPERAARRIALVALRRCPSEAVDPSGTASHALLGVAAARHLAARMPPDRAPLALLQAGLFAAAEADRSPYFSGRYDLPPPARVPAAGLAAALAAMDLDRADGAAAAGGRQALPELATAAVAGLGHLGHRVIFVAVAHDLARDEAVELVRAPARYLASHAAVDGTARDVAAARPGGAYGRAATLGARMAAGEPAAAVAEDLVNQAAELIHRAGRVDAATGHVVTWCAAVRGLVDVLPDPVGGVLAAATWLERVEAGGSELGPWTEGPPIAPRSGSLGDLVAAIRRSDEAGAAAIALALPAAPELWGVLAELALIAGEVSVQHAVKLVAAVPDGPVGQAVAARFLAWAYGGEGPDHRAALGALGLSRHPALVP